MLNHIHRYLNRIQRLSTSRFITEVAILTLLVKILFSVVVVVLFGTHLPELEMQMSYADITDPLFVAEILILAPFIETIIFQFLLIEISYFISKTIWFAVLPSTIIFSFLHGFPDALAVLPGGLLFAYAYYIQRARGIWHAIWITFVLHMIHNIFAYSFSVLDILYLEPYLNKFGV